MVFYVKFVNVLGPPLVRGEVEGGSSGKRAPAPAPAPAPHLTAGCMNVRERACPGVQEACLPHRCLGRGGHGDQGGGQGLQAGEHRSTDI